MAFSKCPLISHQVSVHITLIKGKKNIIHEKLKNQVIFKKCLHFFQSIILYHRLYILMPTALAFHQ